MLFTVLTYVLADARPALITLKGRFLVRNDVLHAFL
jgi:hypothetical protein